jgi:hypothetical protein
MTAAMIPATPAADPTVKADPALGEEEEAAAEPLAEGEPDWEPVADPEAELAPEAETDPELSSVLSLYDMGRLNIRGGVQTRIGRTGLDGDGVRVVWVSGSIDYSDGTVHQLLLYES